MSQTSDREGKIWRLYGRQIVSAAGMTLADHVHDILCGEIHAGRWKIGARLPSMGEIANQSGLSLGPIIRAFKMLETEGYVRQEERRGTFLASVLPRGHSPLGAIGVLIAEDGALLPLLNVPVRERSVHDILEEAVKRDYLTQVLYLKSEQERETACVAGGLFNDQVCGVISFSPLPCSSLDLTPGRIPVVFCGVLDPRCYPSVLPDKRYGFYQLTRRAIAMGHRRIVLCSCAELDDEQVDFRLQGHQRAMEEAGLAVDCGALERSRAISSSDLRAYREFLDATREATVLIAMENSLTRRIIAVADMMNIQVPEDLSVIGEGQGPMRSHQPDRELTCISGNPVRMASACFDILFEQMKNRRASLTRVYVAPLFFEGHSLAPPRPAKARIAAHAPR